MNRERVYAVTLSALNSVSTHIRVMCYRTRKVDDALADELQQMARKDFPAEQGYHDHRVAFVPVPDAWYTLKEVDA